MAPKKKTQKMALSDFFADTPTSGSWADDDVSALPSAPAKKDSTAPRRGEAGYLDSMPDRGSRAPGGGFAGAPSREEVPVPDVPPFTAFVGNLTFETDEEELRGFFSAQSPTSVRLVKDPTGKPKGFGYVEFGSRQGLVDALDKGMTMLGGRTIRVSVAEPPASNRSGFGPSAAEEASQWRRSGPLPARDAPTPRRGPSFADSPRDGPGAGPAPERDLDWGAARGARFQPAPPASDFRRESFGAGQGREPRERDNQFSAGGVADSADRWRSNKPAALAPEAGRPGPGPRGAASGQSSPGLADTEQTWARGTKLRTPAETPPLTPNPDGESPKTPAAPLERKKLTLAPRSGQQSATATPASAGGSSSSIFGAAKPIDSATREAQVEAKRQEERKKAAEERARKEKEEEAKIQAEADARAKAIADAREAVRKERGEPPAPVPSAGAAGGGRKQSQGQGQMPPRQNSNSHSMPPRGNSNSNGSRPAKGGRSNSAQKTEDGFEIAKGSRRDREAAAAPPVKRDAPIRQGFSFAAAAGLVDEGAKSEETDEDVSKRMSEVKV